MSYPGGLAREAMLVDQIAATRPVCGLGDFGGAIVTVALATGTVGAAAVGAGIFAGGIVATSQRAPSEFTVGIAAAIGAALGAGAVQVLALTRPA